MLENQDKSSDEPDAGQRQKRVASSTFGSSSWYERTGMLQIDANPGQCRNEVKSLMAYAAGLFPDPLASKGRSRSLREIHNNSLLAFSAFANF